SSPANGSSRASSRSAPSSTTTFSLPRRLQACAISAPMAPPPSTSSRRGTSLALVIARLSHGPASRKPGTGGLTPTPPVGSPGPPPPPRGAGGTLDVARPSPRQPPGTAHQLNPRGLQPAPLPVVMPVRGHVVALGECGGGVQRSRDRFRRPGRAPRRGQDIPG